MDIEAARAVKQELVRSAVTALGAEPAEGGGALVVGVRTYGGGRYGVAVRHDGGGGAAVAARALEMAGEDADVRDVGRVVALTLPVGPEVPAGPVASPADPGRWAADVLQQRERPLRPGLSVAQAAVTAGTIGGFVLLEGDDRVHVLSNNHVLGDSDRAAVGSDVLQPGSADGGTAPDDVVGTLAVAVPLDPAGGNRVDAALARLADGVEVDATYPVGAVTTVAAADDGLVVEKVGRTTGLTRGVVTAIELDGVAVGFPGGVVTFDDQIEVTGDGGAFSAGGDSGSLVYDPATGAGVGLLFAGSERGGPEGTGLTFCNPVGAVLEALGARLLG